MSVWAEDALPCEIRPVRLKNGGDHEGALVFIDDALVAVMAKLGPDHNEAVGRWHVEFAFGNGKWANTMFPDLEAARSFFDKASAGS